MADAYQSEMRKQSMIGMKRFSPGISFEEANGGYMSGEAKIYTREHPEGSLELNHEFQSFGQLAIDVMRGNSQQIQFIL